LIFVVGFSRRCFLWHFLRVKCAASVIAVSNWRSRLLACWMLSDTQASTSAKKDSVQAELVHQSGRASPEPSETPRWRIIPCPASIKSVALYIALWSLFHCLFAFCRSPILNDHSGVVANCDNKTE
jgi:hypothetical protein